MGSSSSAPAKKPMRFRQDYAAMPWNALGGYDMYETQEAVIRDVACPKCQRKSLLKMTESGHYRILFVTLGASASSTFFKCTNSGCTWTGNAKDLTGVPTPTDLLHAPVTVRDAQSALDEQSPLPDDISVLTRTTTRNTMRTADRSLDPALNSSGLYQPRVVPSVPLGEGENREDAVKRILALKADPMPVGKKAKA